MNLPDRDPDLPSKWIAFVLDRERLSFSGELFHGLIHNVNTPLQNISMLIEFMEAELERLYGSLGLGSEGKATAGSEFLDRFRQRLQKLAGQAALLDSMMRDLWRLSEMERNAAELDLKQLMTALPQFFCCDLFFKHKVQFELKITDTLPLIHVHGLHLIGALFQLFQNAMIALRRAPEKRLIIESRREDETIWVSLRDSGCGLKPGEEHRCFDLFYSGWPPEDQELQKHFGVGLFLASSLLKPYGVSISIRTEGIETVASLEIPINAHKPFERLAAKPKGGTVERGFRKDTQ